MKTKINHDGQKGQTLIGLLVMVVFIISLVLYNSPDLSLTNKVAYATSGGGGSLLETGGGGGGGGGGSIGSSSGGAILCEKPVEELGKVINLGSLALRSGGVSSLNSNVSLVVDCVIQLNNSGQLGVNKPLVVKAINTVLIALIEKTIELISVRINELTTLSNSA